MIKISDYLNLVTGLGTVNEDWTEALNKANTDIFVSRQATDIIIDRDIQIKNTVYINPETTSIIGNGHTITCDLIGDKYAIEFINTIVPCSVCGGARSVCTCPPQTNISQSTICATTLDRVKFICKTPKSSHGLKLGGIYGKGGTAGMSFNRVLISGFETALTFFESAYCISFYNCDFATNTTCLNFPNNSSNSGERLSFFGCDFFNSNRGIYSDNPNLDLYMYGCSLDFFNENVFNIQKGKLYMYGCHIENYMTSFDNSKIPFIIGNGNGASVRVNGGFIGFHNSTNPQIDFVFLNNATGKGGLWIDGVYIERLTSKSKHLIGGSGYTKISNITSCEISESYFINSSKMNLLADGDFENDTIADDIYVYEDTQQVVPHSYTGANINLATSTDTSRNYSKSLKLTKTYGQGSLSSAIVKVPVHDGDLIGAEWYMKKLSDSLIGNVKFTSGFTKVNARGEFKKFSILNTSEVIPSQNWDFCYSLPQRTPSWATHFYIIINLFNINNGSIYIDDFNISKM